MNSFLEDWEYAAKVGLDDKDILYYLYDKIDNMQEIHLPIPENIRKFTKLLEDEIIYKTRKKLERKKFITEKVPFFLQRPLKKYLDID